jgi:hypothetical protein
MAKLRPIGTADVCLHEADGLRLIAILHLNPAFGKWVIQPKVLTEYCPEGSYDTFQEAMAAAEMIVPLPLYHPPF